MKLLVVTQAVDTEDSALGFFHQWIQEFARCCERVEVICLYEGRHNLPENVVLHSLGKEKGSVSKIVYAYRFWQLLFSGKLTYDKVFVHMNPEYLVLGGLWWRLIRKPVGLWYSHRKVSLRLRLAVLFANVVFTTAAGSINARTNKLHIMGHGIEVKSFMTAPVPVIDTHAPRLISVGRVTPIKRLDILIDTLRELHNRGIQAQLALVGKPVVSSDSEYAEKLREQIHAQGLDNFVSFVGNIPYERMPNEYALQQMSVNASPTGGVDKAVLESMAAGLIVVVTNTAFESYLGQYAGRLIVEPEPARIAERISELLAEPDLQKMQQDMRILAQRHASLERLIPAIIEELV